MPGTALEIAATLFYSLVGALAAGRVGLFVLKLANFNTLATIWANQFNRLTTYLR